MQGLVPRTGNSGIPGSWRRHPPHMFAAKEKAVEISLNGLYLMPATTYAPTHLARAVPSALRGLTSVFGMGTGGSPAVRSPTSRSCQLSAVSSQLLAEADVLCRWTANLVTFSGQQVPRFARNDKVI